MTTELTATCEDCGNACKPNEDAPLCPGCAIRRVMTFCRLCDSEAVTVALRPGDALPLCRPCSFAFSLGQMYSDVDIQRMKQWKQENLPGGEK